MKKTIQQTDRQGLTVLATEDNFRFTCHAGLDCFTRCCRNISIFLSPYDIIRMKKALKMTSEKFLPTYTLTVPGDFGLPVIMLKMIDGEEKKCPFVTVGGCMIYEDRPWSCRIYPLQPESSKITEKAGKEYYSIMDLPFCLGLREDKTSTVVAWKENQGISVYHEMEQYFKKIMTHANLTAEKIINQKIQEMFYMACYDLDRFRRFVFESKFLEVYAVSPDVVEQMKQDDVALYLFSMKWLEHGLIGQQALRIKPEVIEAKKRQMGIQ